MEIMRKEIEEMEREKENEPERRMQEKLRMEREKEAAFALLKAYSEQSVPVCRECGVKIVAGANFCTSCGKALLRAF